MNLYIAKIETGNSVNDWVEDNYVVAGSYADVEVEFPKAVEIKLVKKGLTILGFEFEGILMETEEHPWVKINSDGSNLPTKPTAVWLNDKIHGPQPLLIDFPVTECNLKWILDTATHYKITNAPKLPKL